MAQVEIVMPKMGESVMEATLTKWLIEEGAKVELDQPLVEIATDKVDSEVPSSHAGLLVKRLFQEGDVVKIGEAFALIETTSNALVVEPTATPSVSVPEIKEAISVSLPVSQSEHTTPLVSTSSRFYSPLVRNIAQQEKISQSELDGIPGTGLEGRVTKNDMLAYLGNRQNPVAQQSLNTISENTLPETKPAPVVISKPAISVSGHDQIIEMDRMRKLIAQNMVMSKQTSAHVTSFVEADVTHLVRWRDKVKSEFEKKYAEKLTYTPIILEAVVQAIKEFPSINVSVDGDRIIIKGRINLGMATALPSGNLIVPVIKNAETMNLYGLTRAVNDLAARARQNKLKPDEIQDGTYTVSNVGTFGNVMGTPIINQPQVAVLATGAIRKRPAVIETPEGDMIGIRHMMFLSHSYDHRVVDGALGGMFVKRVADLLEAFDVNRPI